MKAFLFIFTLSFFYFSGQAQEVLLTPGEIHHLQAPPDQVLSLSQDHIVSVETIGAKIEIMGKKYGQVIIRVGSRLLTLHVISPKTKTSLLQIRELLSHMQGLTAKLDNEQNIEIRGELLRLSDWKVIFDKALHYNWNYKLRAQPTENIVKSIKVWLAEILMEKNLAPGQVQTKPYPSLSLSNGLKSALPLYQTVLKPLGLEVLIHPLQISQEPTVKIDLILAEVDRNFNRELGLQWGDNFTYQAQVLPQWGSNPLAVQLNALESQGRGQILANPSLICRSGAKAEFLAGGEIPIRFSNWGSKGVQWKKHGIVMNFSPKADRSGKMSLSIETELSIPDLSKTFDQLPVFETNRIKSHFDLDKSRTVVLSGLIRQSRSQVRQGLPWLSQIPVLGQLFGSKSFQERKTELVVFVTPKVINPQDLDQQPKLPQGWEE